MLHTQRKAEIQIIMTVTGPVDDLDAVIGEEDEGASRHCPNGVRRLVDYIFSGMTQ